MRPGAPEHATLECGHTTLTKLQTTTIRSRWQSQYTGIGVAWDAVFADDARIANTNVFGQPISDIVQEWRSILQKEAFKDMYETVRELPSHTSPPARHIASLQDTAAQ